MQVSRALLLVSHPLAALEGWQPFTPMCPAFLCRLSHNADIHVTEEDESNVTRVNPNASVASKAVAHVRDMPEAARQAQVPEPL